MSSASELVERWFDFLNRRIEADAVFTEDVVVVYLPEGKGGPRVALRGREAVTQWARRGEDGRFVFSPLGAPQDASPVEDLPPGDGQAWRVGFRVEATFADFANQGDDTLQARGGHICGVLHEPEALPCESVGDDDAR